MGQGQWIFGDGSEPLGLGLAESGSIRSFFFFFGNQIQAARGGLGGDGRRRLPVVSAENPQFHAIDDSGNGMYPTKETVYMLQPAMINLEATPYTPS